MSLGSAQKVCETRSCRDEVTVGKVPRTATQRKQRATLKQSLDTLPCDTVMGILPSTDGSCKTLHFAAEDLLRERQSCIKSMPTRDSVSRNGSSTDKESYACDATTFQIKSRKFVSLQHNKFSLKSATDKYCDGMKSKLNNVDFANRSRTPSRFGALPRPITNNVPFHYSLYRRKQSPDCRFPKYRCDSHGSARKDFNLDNASPPKRPLCNRGYEVKSSRWSYDYCGGENILKETSFVKRPCIDGTYSASGQNCARAFGSPNEYVEHAVQNSSDKAKPVRPHDATSTCSLPAFHLPMIPQSLLPSPASAATTSQSNSDLTAISVSSFSSRHHSHANASYNQFSSTFPGSTYATATNVNVSTRDSILHGPAQNRERSGSNFCNITKSCKANNTELQASKLCSCCFNRPKRFATADELAAHRDMKQYECNYCSHRFKNKNEAKRHEQSLHVRPRTWSCLALTDHGRAFYESTSRPGEADVCGYCGDEFARSGTLSRDALNKSLTDQDWDERIRHLKQAHKFRECNSSQNFYRADHIRQHNKLCHAATRGKWTNMLDNACLINEDPVRSNAVLRQLERCY